MARLATTLGSPPLASVAARPSRFLLLQKHRCGLQSRTHTKQFVCSSLTKSKSRFRGIRFCGDGEIELACMRCNGLNLPSVVYLVCSHRALKDKRNAHDASFNMSVSREAQETRAWKLWHSNMPIRRQHIERRLRVSESESWETSKIWRKNSASFCNYVVCT